MPRTLSFHPLQKALTNAATLAVLFLLLLLLAPKCFQIAPIFKLFIGSDLDSLETSALPSFYPCAHNLLLQREEKSNKFPLPEPINLAPVISITAAIKYLIS